MVKYEILNEETFFKYFSLTNIKNFKYKCYFKLQYFDLKTNKKLVFIRRLSEIALPDNYLFELSDKTFEAIQEYLQIVHSEFDIEYIYPLNKEKYLHFGYNLLYFSQYEYYWNIIKIYQKNDKKYLAWDNDKLSIYSINSNKIKGLSDCNLSDDEITNILDKLKAILTLNKL